MRIIQIVDSLEAGGTERMCVNIANALSSAGIQNGVVITRQPYTLKNRINYHTSVFTSDKKSRWDFNTFMDIYRFVRKEKPLFMHAHSTTLFWACLIKILCPDIVLIWHDHYGNRKHAKDNFFHILLSIFINAIITVNDDIAQWNKKHMSVSKANIIHLPNFANVRINENASHKPDTIVITANLLPVKDHITLLKALNILQQQYPWFKVYFMGKEADPIYAHKVKELIRDLGLSGKINILGQVDDVDSILAEASIGVLCSKSEGLPVSVIEYGLAGLSVVCTNVGECNALLEDGLAGWLFEPEDEETLAQLLLHILTHKEAAAIKAKRLTERIKTHYSEQTFMDHYKLLLQKLT